LHAADSTPQGTASTLLYSTDGAEGHDHRDEQGFNQADVIGTGAGSPAAFRFSWRRRRITGSSCFAMLIVGLRAKSDVAGSGRK
jgi:hypothetical protein